MRKEIIRGNYKFQFKVDKDKRIKVIIYSGNNDMGSYGSWRLENVLRISPELWNGLEDFVDRFVLNSVGAIKNNLCKKK